MSQISAHVVAQIVQANSWIARADDASPAGTFEALIHDPASGDIKKTDLSNVSGGEANTMTNLGSGTQIYKQKSGVQFELKSLVAGAGITLTADGDGITIAASGSSGESNTMANLGSGNGVYKQKTGVQFELKSLIAGSGITITSNDDDLTLTADGSAGLPVVESTYLTYDLLDNDKKTRLSTDGISTSGGKVAVRCIMPAAVPSDAEYEYLLPYNYVASQPPNSQKNSNNFSALSNWYASDFKRVYLCVDEVAGTWAAITAGFNEDLSYSSLIQIDLRQSSTFNVTLTGNSEFRFNNPKECETFRLELTQDSTGSRTITWPTSVKWDSSTAPTLTTTGDKKDLLEFVCLNADSGSEVFVGRVVAQNY